jgi:hypothetical protein
MIVGVDVLSKRQRRARLSLHLIRLPWRRRWLCDWKLFMALVRRGGKVVVGALVRVGVRQRDEHGRAVLRHGIRKCAKLIPAQTVEVVDVDRSR